MNKLLITSLLVGFSFCAVASEQPQWKARSVESQFSETGSTLTKSSVTKNTSKASKQAAAAQRLSARKSAADMEFWIYDAWITLEVDSDYDGYYHELTLEFDADTVYAHASVYARLYLSSGGDFYEYHTTSDFHIDGEDSQDSFVVETELLEGFPADDYELLIELYDNDTGELVATLDGYDDDDLYLLPLESNDYEYRSGGQVTVTTEHGGSLGLFTGIILIMLLGYRLTNRQP